LVESLHSFRQDRFVASAVLLGVAAERTFLVIAKSLLEALKDAIEQAKFKELLDRQPMKPKQDWVHAKLLELDENRRKLPDDFQETTPLMVTGIYDLICRGIRVVRQVGGQSLPLTSRVAATVIGPAATVKSFCEPE
jgi:hypothetical protein